MTITLYIDDAGGLILEKSPRWEFVPNRPLGRPSTTNAVPPRNLRRMFSPGVHINELRIETANGMKSVDLDSEGSRV